MNQCHPRGGGGVVVARMLHRVPMTKRTRETDALLFQQNDLCYVCERALDGEVPLQVDHKMRLSDGGSDDLSNKCVLCVPCHGSKTVRENAMLPSFEYTTETINEFIRHKQSSVPKQTHQRYSIQQLRGWWNDGALRRAACNRDAVWNPGKRHAFLCTLFEGGITPPIFLNDLRTQGGIKEIYDGVNRLTTIMQFMDGKSHITYQRGRVAISATFGPCKCEVGCMKRCVPLDPINRRMFESIMIDTFLWDKLSTAEACNVAQHLNEGTPMSIGEKLRLLCGIDTHRARSLKHIYESQDFQAIIAQDRERERKTLALFMRHLASPDSVFSSALTSNFSPLENYYRCPEPFDAKVLRRAEMIIARTHAMLAERTKTKHNVFLCLYGLLHEDRYDVQGALSDQDCDRLSPEEILQRWRLPAPPPLLPSPP